MLGECLIGLVWVMCFNSLAREGQSPLIGSPYKDQWIGVVQKRMVCHCRRRVECRLGRHKQQMSTKLVTIIRLYHLDLVEEVLKRVIATEQKGCSNLRPKQQQQTNKSYGLFLDEHYLKWISYGKIIGFKAR